MEWAGGWGSRADRQRERKSRQVAKAVHVRPTDQDKDFAFDLKYMGTMISCFKKITGNDWRTTNCRGLG